MCACVRALLCDGGGLTQAAELTDNGGERVVHHTLQLAADALGELPSAEVARIDVPLHQRHGEASHRHKLMEKQPKKPEEHTVSSTLTGFSCVNGYYFTGRGHKESTDGPVDRKTNRDNQKCPKARRLVATSKEIKALGKERCQLIPGWLVTGPAGIPTQNSHSWIWEEKYLKP